MWDVMNYPLMESESGQAGSGGGSGASSGDPAPGTSAAPSSETPPTGSSDDLPSRQNLQGENTRLRNENRTLMSRRDNLQSLVTRMGGTPSSGTPRAGQPAAGETPIDDLVANLPKQYEEPEEYNKSIARMIRSEATRISRTEAGQAVQTGQRQTEVKAAGNRKQEVTDRNVERFRESREWTGDENSPEWQGFITHMNSVYGEGPNGEITTRQLNQQEKAYRGDEMINEAITEGQRTTTQAIRRPQGARQSRGRTAPMGINDMSLDEQLGALAEVGGEDQQKLYDSITDPKRQRDILEIVDKDSRDDR